MESLPTASNLHQFCLIGVECNNNSCNILISKFHSLFCDTSIKQQKYLRCQLESSTGYKHMPFFGTFACYKLLIKTKRYPVYILDN